jgi:hypothetical protein
VQDLFIHSFDQYLLIFIALLILLLVIYHSALLLNEQGKESQTFGASILVR